MDNTRSDIIKVTDGSIYKVKGNKTNPLQLCFSITYRNGFRKRERVNGKTEDELFQKKKIKISEALEKYKSEQKALETKKEMETAELVNKYPSLEVPRADGQIRPITFREVSEMWFREFAFINESKGNSFSNLDSAKHSLKAINKVIGDMEISKIDKWTAQEMINKVSVDDNGNYRSKSHVEKAMRKFKNVMEFALENGYTKEHIGKLYINKNVKEPDKDARFLDKESLRELFNCINRNPFYNTLVNLMLSSGLRQEEALALTIDDVEIRGGICQVYVNKVVTEVASNQYEVVNRLKQGERARFVTITREVYDMLIDYYNTSIQNKELLEKRKTNGTEKLLFVNKNGEVRNKRTLQNNLRGYLERNIKTEGKEGKATLHMLRHTFASFLKSEIPLGEITDILGHSDISITKKYYDTETEEDRKRKSIGIENMIKNIKS